LAWARFLRQHREEAGPRLSMLRRFAKAVGVDVKELELL
jgi:hypothetical protein